MRPTFAEIDLSAIAHNVGLLAELAGEARLCVVVKADGYGHGAVPVARTAVASGASWLAVALVEEGVELREGGIDSPILLLSEPRPNEMMEVAHYRLRPTVYSPEGISAVTAAQSGATGTIASSPAPDSTASDSPASPSTAEGSTGTDNISTDTDSSTPTTSLLSVHLKIDTGMHRVGVPPSEALQLTETLRDKPGINLEGIWTHCATADSTADNFADIQLDRFQEVLDDLKSRNICPPIRHAANSSALLTRSRSHYDLVRVGITAYGISPIALEDPLVHPSLSAQPSTAQPSTSQRGEKATATAATSPASPAANPASTQLSEMSKFVISQLRPAMRLSSQVSYVKSVKAGEGVSYGHLHKFSEDTRVATVPIGYADGVRRDFGLRGGEVLIGGQRHSVVGAVTMDQLMVDVGTDLPIAPGDEVVLIGTQEQEEITASEIARREETIPYEVVCDVGKRVRREYI